MLNEVEYERRDSELLKMLQALATHQATITLTTDGVLVESNTKKECWYIKGSYSEHLDKNFMEVYTL